jgi:hypothetical protein
VTQVGMLIPEHHLVARARRLFSHWSAFMSKFGPAEYR